MGRIARRVPLDFAWPKGKVYSGFRHPEHFKCEPCDGRGSTVGRERLDEILHLLFVGEKEHRQGRPEDPTWSSVAWGYSHNRVPGEDYADLCARLSVHPGGHERDFFGRDIYSARRIILAAVGIDEEEWGTCPHCGGDGCPFEHQDERMAWEPTPPPEGDGWQLWSTNDFPVSPVLPSSEALIDWLVETGEDVGVLRPGTRDEWTKIVSGEGIWLSFGGRVT
jgi:hypothetical protein